MSEATWAFDAPVSTPIVWASSSTIAPCTRDPIYLQLPSNTLAVPFTVKFGQIENPSPHALAVGDVNGDGLPDIVAADNYFPGLDVLLHAPAN